SPENSMFAKCPCNNCSEHLEFDESDAGSTVTCPHCGLETTLFVPPHSIDVPPKIARAHRGRQVTVALVLGLGVLCITAALLWNRPRRKPVAKPAKQLVTGAFGFSLAERLPD